VSSGRRRRATHRLDDVIGFTRLKEFIRTELTPRFTAPPAEALAGVAVCGPIGGGKTFIFEAVAAELDMVVLVLKNIRSQWFGQTDVIFERLRRVLDALAKVLIFVDEADTQFGGVGADTHETERRLTGKIQAMMSDPALRGRVFWLRVTARIHLLSPDLRRPGRVGDLIIPTLDPEGPDRTEFLRWTVQPTLAAEPTPAQIQALDEATPAAAGRKKPAVSRPRASGDRPGRAWSPADPAVALPFRAAISRLLGASVHGKLTADRYGVASRPATHGPKWQLNPDAEPRPAPRGRRSGWLAWAWRLV
jgi:hypothetical protein